MHERRRFPGSGEQCPGAPYMDMKIGVFHCRVDLESLSPPTCSISFLCSSPFPQPSFCIVFCSSVLVRLQRSGAQSATSEFCFRLLPCSGSGFKNTQLETRGLSAASPLLPPTSMLIAKGLVFRAGFKNTHRCQKLWWPQPSIPTLKKGARGIPVQCVF